MKRLLLIAALLLVAVAPASAQIPTPSPGICVDWNGRGGCGANDHFVEVYFPFATSMAGWRMVVGTCSYTYAADNIVFPFQVLWADMMDNCENGFPSSGMAVLYDANNVVRDFRMYTTIQAGYSWQAEVSANPYGPWISGWPNPGR